MFCKYCNADLKPSDKICPVCEKPINDVEGISNVVEDTIEDIDQSLFAPLESSNYSVETEPPVEDLVLENEQVNTNEIDNSEVTQKALEKLKELQEMNDLNEPRKSVENREYKNPMSFVPIIILVFLIIALGFGFFLSRSPKMVFNTLINKVYKEINNNVVTDIKNVKSNMFFQTNVSTTSGNSNSMFEILNNIYFGVDYEIDYERENALIKLNTKYDNEKLIDADLYIDDNKGYIFLKDVFSKYISTDVQDVDSLFETVEIADDHKTVLSEIKIALTKSLKSEYFVKTKEDIKIDNKNISAVKNSLIIDDETANKIMIDILTYLKDSESFVDSLSDISEINKSEILTALEDELDLLTKNPIEPNDTKMTISIYTKGLINEVVKIDLAVEEANEKISIELLKQRDDNYDIVLNSAGSTINGTIKMLENNDDMTKVEISIIEPTSGVKFGITMGMSVKYNTKLSNVDVTNNVDVNALTEEETNHIMSKLMESKGIQKLMTVIEGFSNLYYDDTDEYGNGIICGDGVECYYDDEIIY